MRLKWVRQKRISSIWGGICIRDEDEGYCQTDIGNMNSRTSLFFLIGKVYSNEESLEACKRETPRRMIRSLVNSRYDFEIISTVILPQHVKDCFPGMSAFISGIKGSSV